MIAAEPASPVWLIETIVTSWSMLSAGSQQKRPLSAISRSTAAPMGEVRVKEVGPWALSWSILGRYVRVSLSSENGVEIDGSSTELLRIVERPHELSRSPLELQSVAVTTLEGPPLWVTVDEGSVRDRTKNSDPPVTSRSRGQISATPNPANPRTSFRITAPDRGTVSLGVFDVRGRRVWEQIFEVAVAGEFDVLWSGIDTRGQQVASGVYTARAVGRGWQATTRVVIVR